MYHGSSGRKGALYGKEYLYEVLTMARFNRLNSILMKHLTIVLLLCFFSQTINAQSSKKSGYQIEGMTMAITNMDQMLAFYSNVFNIEFKEQELNGFKLYAGKWGDLKLLFCPAELARNQATQNRHQFDVIVPDLEDIIRMISSYGGKSMGNKAEGENEWSVGVYDPDMNSINFKQLK